MIEEKEATTIDGWLTRLPELLLERGITLKQKHRYKAGKLSQTRNWCQLIDEDARPRVCTSNTQGQIKTWKLFARFDSNRSPLLPWEQPERGEDKKAQSMISGSDVWGITYEDIRELAKGVSSKEIVERLARDLKVSFDYSRQRYC